MTRALILTQGRLGVELLEAARTIAGAAEDIEALALGWDDPLETVENKVRAAIERNGANEGLLILTDVPGGTPCNVARQFAIPGGIEVLSGVNLPMVVRLCCPGCADKPVGELAEWLEGKGRQSVRRETAEVDPTADPGSDD